MTAEFGSAAVPFVKASACGNDFLIIEGEQASGDLAEFTRRVCDRRKGVGADGVEWLYPSKDSDVEARLINADGTPAEISGNGTRCVAAAMASQHNKERLVIRTGAGLKTCNLTSHSGNVYEFETGMGVPVVEEELSLVLNRGVVRGIPVSMGNPHYVVFVDEILPDWMVEASEIGHHPHFKQGVNVEVVAIEDANNIDVRFFERGVEKHCPREQVHALRRWRQSRLNSQVLLFKYEPWAVCKPCAGSEKSCYADQPKLSVVARFFCNNKLR